MLIGLGEAQRLTGDAGYRETLLEASRIASTVNDAELAAKAALANSSGIASVIGESDTEKLASIERALELDDGSDLGRRARLCALHATELLYDSAELEHRRALADEAISLARRAGEPGALAHVLHNAFSAIWSADTLARRVAITDELSSAASQAQDPALQWWAIYSELVVSLELGEIERAAAAIRREQQVADELGQPTLLWLASVHGATLELSRGDLATGERLAERAFHLAQDADALNGALYYGAQLSFVRAFQGRGAEVVAMMEQSVAAHPGIPAWRGGLAHVYCGLGQFDKAATIVQDAARDRFEHIPWDPVRMTALALYAAAAAQSGCGDAAATLYDLLEPWENQLASTDILNYGHTRMYLGELAHTNGRDELAIEHLEFACRFHEDHGLLLWAAESQLWLAVALTDRGDSASARHHARSPAPVPAPAPATAPSNRGLLHFSTAPQPRIARARRTRTGSSSGRSPRRAIAPLPAALRASRRDSDRAASRSQSRSDHRRWAERNHRVWSPSAVRLEPLVVSGATAPNAARTRPLGGCEALAAFAVAVW